MLPGGYSRGVQTTLSYTSVMHCTPPQVNAVGYLTPVMDGKVRQQEWGDGGDG